MIIFKIRYLKLYKLFKKIFFIKIKIIIKRINKFFILFSIKNDIYIKFLKFKIMSKINNNKKL